MSFLISFNGQFSPYVHPALDAWKAKVNPVHSLEPLEAGEVDHHSPDFKTRPTPVGPELKNYQKQVKTFEQAKKRIYARDLMSSPVHFVKSTQSATVAVELMKKFGFRHFPVLDDKQQLSGLLSDRELIQARANASCGELMVPKVLVALQSARIQEIAHIMLQEKINALPIINDHHHVVGIITQSDILRFVIGSEEFSGLG